MSKTIKLDPETYLALEKFQGKKETFSEAVARALKIVEVVGKIETRAPGNNGGGKNG